MTKSDRLLTLSEAARFLHVHVKTLRAWDGAGKLVAARTPGGHRRYRLSEIESLMGETKTNDESGVIRVAIYCRVSSHDQKQKGDLERQVGRMSAHCIRKGYRVIDVMDDVGSGMSDNRPKLRRLFGLVGEQKIDRVVVEHKDRLSRFGFGLLEAYFASHDVTIEWIHEVLGKSYEDELVGDILSLMASFSARIYGRRSAENRRKKAEAMG